MPTFWIVTFDTSDTLAFAVAADAVNVIVLKIEIMHATASNKEIAFFIIKTPL